DPDPVDAIRVDGGTDPGVACEKGLDRIVVDVDVPAPGPGVGCGGLVPVADLPRAKTAEPAELGPPGDTGQAPVVGPDVAGRVIRLPRRAFSARAGVHDRQDVPVPVPRQVVPAPVHRPVGEGVENPLDVAPDPGGLARLESVHAAP